MEMEILPKHSPVLFDSSALCGLAVFNLSLPWYACVVGAPVHLQNSAPIPGYTARMCYDECESDYFLHKDIYKYSTSVRAGYLLASWLSF